MTGRTLTHGTQTGYSYHGCRCADCTDAHRLAEAGRRARRAARLAADQDIPHGKPNGYSTFGCRCEPCRQAISEYRRDLRQRRKNGAPIRKLAPRRPAPAPPECEGRIAYRKHAQHAATHGTPADLERAIRAAAPCWAADDLRAEVTA